MLLVILLIAVTSLSAENSDLGILHSPFSNKEVLLRETLFKSSRYHPKVRPVLNFSDAVHIKIDVALHHIIDLNEKYQFLESQLWFRLYWNDVFLRWNPSEYGGITNIQANMMDAWTPDIEIFNEVGLEGKDERTRFPITIYFNGNMTWLFNRVVQTGCKINITYFPYDNQTCYLNIGSWTLDYRFVKVTARRTNGDNSTYRGNGEWEVVGIPANDELTPYSASSWRWHVVTFSILLIRRPNYYIFHMIFPCILLSFVNTCSFLLPVSSGERISMSVTTLLGLVVFLLIVAELMPPQADFIPIIYIYFGMSITIVALSVLLNVFIIHLHFRGSRGSRMPHWLRAVIYRIGVIVCYRKLMNDVGFELNNNFPTSRDVELTYNDQAALVDATRTRKISPNSSSPAPPVKTLKKRSSEIFGCEEAYLSVMRQHALDMPTKYGAPARRCSSSPSLHNLDPILKKELQKSNKTMATVHESTSTEWKVAALVLDRLLFVSFFALMTSLMVFVLSYRPPIVPS